jgi:hypothetical protein
MGQHRAVLRLLGRSTATALALVLVLGVPLAGASHANAQDRDAAAPVVRAGAPAETWAPGPPPELWAPPAVGLGLGGLTLALAVVLGQVASANYHEAIDPMTTQARAYDLARTVPDLSLAANVLFAVGGGMATLGAIWLIAVPFGQHRVAAEAPAVRAAIGPGGLTISGSF